MKKSGALSEKKAAKRVKTELNQSVRKVSKTIGLIIAAVVFGSVTLLTALVVMAHISSHRDSVAESQYLRDVAEGLGLIGHNEQQAAEAPSALDIEMLQINPDFVGWINIDGTEIDYPVVRGADNVRYLNTSFQGERNPNGAIFMDFRNLSIRTMPHLIIYGHNAPMGGMFSDLHKFLDRDFFEEHDTLTLKVGNETLEFTIFDARLTDITDYAYHLDFSYSRAFPRFADRIEAPLRAMQIITLSTCTNCPNDDARLVVQAYR